MNDNITMNTEAFNAMLEEYRSEGYQQGINKIITVLNKCVFVEQGASVKGEDISLYLMQYLAKENEDE
jgi:hypothetical protein